VRHVVSIRKRENPRNEKALKTTTVLPLSYRSILFKCSWLSLMQREHFTSIIRERTVGYPSAIEGQNVNIKDTRTGLWSTLGVMLNEFAYEFLLKVCEESR